MWLLAAISTYIILAVVQLVDKYLLVGPIPNPKVYAFYVGTLGVLVLALAPFVGFYLPEINQIVLSLLAGAVFVYALFWLYKGLQLFEASRVIPAIGGLVPLFTFGLVYLFSFGKENLTLGGGIAFVLLISGSVLIVLRKEKLVNLKSLKISLIAAFFMSLSFVLVKYVYLALPFWTGFLWKSIGGFLMALSFFIFIPEVRREIFKRRERSPKKTVIVFLANQAAGGGAAILQNWAIALAPLAYVAFINALQGIQYVFLFIFALLFSFKFPQILKEEVSQKVIFQKIIAILLIGGGLVFLAL
jgi:drug/metabolite transporter (DMT)-like permease